MNGFFNPKGFLLTGVLIILCGFLLNQFLGMQGELLLTRGEPKALITDKDSTIHKPNETRLGMQITLDSLEVHAYTPSFEFLVMGPDTTSNSPGISHGAGPLIDKYPAAQMKIRKVGESDFYFRMKAFYPNFQFAYEYPVNRDTIEPKAPGITLELKTKEGKPIVTLRSDQPNKHTLGDIVSLGASLFYYRESAMDSMNALNDAKQKSGNKVVFSGRDQKVYFLYQDTTIEQTLREGLFYKMPGQDTVGFTILYSFPDYAFLKAVPSTKDTLMLNPVAHVEVWKAGEGYRDAFLYPEKRGRKGGEYPIPESGFKLGMGEVKEGLIKHCDCFLSIQANSRNTSKQLDLLSGNSGNFKGYRFTPMECTTGGDDIVKIKVAKKPGNILVITGAAIIMLTFSYMVFKKNRQVH